MEKINLNGLFPSLSRAYEIALLGNFSISIMYQLHGEYPQVHEDYQAIKDFFDVPFVENGDITLEISKPKSRLASASQSFFETKDDIKARVNKAMQNPLPTEFNYINRDASEQLLKVATERLSLSVLQVEKTKEIAAVIARLEGSSTIESFHIAEAIHYQHCYNYYDHLVCAENAIVHFGDFIRINSAGLTSMYGDPGDINDAIKFLKKLLK